MRLARSIVVWRLALHAFVRGISSAGRARRAGTFFSNQLGMDGPPTAIDASASRLVRFKNSYVARALLLKDKLGVFAAAMLHDDPAQLASLMLVFPDIYSPQKIQEPMVIDDGVVWHPLKIIAHLGAVRVLIWWIETFGPIPAEFGMVMLERCAMTNNFDLMRVLLSRPEVVDKVREDWERDPQQALSLVPDGDDLLPEFMDILGAIVAIFKRLKISSSPDVSFRNGVPWVLDLWGARSMVAEVHLDLLKPSLQDHERWFGYIFDKSHVENSITTLGIQFLWFIQAESLSDSDRREIVGRYRYLIESRLKDRIVFSYLVSNGLYEPKKSLLRGVLDVSPPFEYDGSGYHEDDLAEFSTRLEIYSLFIFALKHVAGPPDAGLLAEAIRLVRPNGLLQGLRGLVRALLYHGADPQAYIVKRTIRSLAANASERYTGFAEDIKAARSFLRWGERHLFGGLPREILEMIMYRTWEPREDQD